MRLVLGQMNARIGGFARRAEKAALIPIAQVSRA